MSVQPINFFSTTLRAPVGVSDTQLLLASGSSTPLNAITSGNYAYVTVNDGVTTEIMRYTSSGTVVSDTITVIRAQDSTTAKAFPTGACVRIVWNLQQMIDFIALEIAGGTFPSCVIPITTISGLPGIPDANVFFAVNTDTGSMWYFMGPLAADWIKINSNSLQLGSGAPSIAPADNIQWYVDIVTSFLYYWNGVTWVVISGERDYTEVWGRRYLDGVGIAIASGTDNVFGPMETATTIVPLLYNYTSNALVPTVMTATATNAMECGANCIAEFTASVQGTLAAETSAFKAQIVLFHADNAAQYTNQFTYPANSGGTAVAFSATSGPVFINIGDIWDANLVVIDDGVASVGFQLLQFEVTVKVIALR